MSEPRAPDVVIWGLTSTGRTFRPSDWSDRLAGLTAAFHLSDRYAYSALVEPTLVKGVRAVVVSGELARKEPRLHRFLLGFARDNDLVTTEVSTEVVDPQGLTPPEVTRPPRSGEPQEPI